jgi:uncharacterized beta barrel domain-containing protein DUF5777
MKKLSTIRVLSIWTLSVWATSTFLFAQETQPPPQEPPAAPEAQPEPPPPPRAPEGSVIINLPSVDVPKPGTLTLLFTHRFSQAVSDSDIHSLFSFDSGADIGIGLAYAPIKNLDISFYRSSSIDIYEVAAKYRAISHGPFGLAVRVGGDWRTEVGAIFDSVPGYSHKNFFAQVSAAWQFGSRARLTVVPTYVQEMSGQPTTTPQPNYKDVFQVPVALSIAVTRSINVQGEVYPSTGRTDSAGVGWIVAVEKTLLRHRFAFTCGNMRATTADQYVSPVPFGTNPNNYYFGFNLVRQWSLKK